jgi:hypothetical protein
LFQGVTGASEGNNRQNLPIRWETPSLNFLPIKETFYFIFKMLEPEPPEMKVLDIRSQAQFSPHGFPPDLQNAIGSQFAKPIVTLDYASSKQPPSAAKPYFLPLIGPPTNSELLCQCN